MGNAGEALPVRVTAGYEVKASALRGYLTAMERMGVRGAVLARLPPDVRALLESPPPATQWIDAGLTGDVVRAVAEVKGMGVVREFSRDALREGVMPLVRSVTQGLLRLFGTSPAAIYSRTSLMTASNLRGVDFAYTPLARTEGQMELRFPRARDVPMETFLAFAGAFELTLELCGAQGRVEDPVLLRDGAGNAAQYRIRWS